MVELLALAVTELTHGLWHRGPAGWVVAVAAWSAFGSVVPVAVLWAEEELPEALNLAMPFAAVAFTAVSTVRHWRHQHHHADPHT